MLVAEQVPMAKFSLCIFFSGLDGIMRAVVMTWSHDRGILVI